MLEMFQILKKESDNIPQIDTEYLYSTVNESNFSLFLISEL